MGRRSNIDWPAIRARYQFSTESIRQIAKQHGVAESNLRRRAKEEGWTRDGAETVRRARAAALEEIKASAQEIGSGIGAKMSAETAHLGREIVGAAVVDGVAAVQDHRRVVRKAVVAIERLLDQLLEISRIGEARRQDIAVLAEVNPSLAALVERSLGLRSQVEMLDRCGSAMARIFNVERQAHDLDREEGGKKSEIDELLLRIHSQGSAVRSVNEPQTPLPN